MRSSQEMSVVTDSEKQAEQRGSEFCADYYLRGPATGLSNYEGYSWKPQLTVPVCKLMMSFLGAQRGDSVLDFGCARGFYIKALIGLGYDAWGYDVSQWAIENCDPEVRNRVFTAPPRPGSLDYILSKDVLEHIEESELRRVISDFIEMTAKAALIIVPLSDAEGQYVSPVDRQDVTHKIAWMLDEWLMFIQGIIDQSGRAFTISGSYKMPGVKRAADPYPRSCGFLVLRRFEYA